MNKLIEQSEQIREARKKYRKFETHEVPVGVILLKDDGSHKCIIQYVEKDHVGTSSKKYPTVKFDDMYKDWLLEIQPGQILVAGAPDDSGLVIP